MSDEIFSDDPETIINLLWNAANEYQESRISGAAIGLLTLGVLQGKPKCVAVQQWITAVWTDYYTRKAALSKNLDYSNNGPMPYTVPELMAEVMGQ